jgi:cation-dependent mannose-6-phosphate receptor
MYVYTNWHRSESSELVLRGRKLVLNYTGGSPCAEKIKSRSTVLDLDKQRRGIVNGDDDDDDKDDKDNKGELVSRYKSTIISLLCDAEATDPKAPKVNIAFVGTDEYECTYFFEARSYAACAGVESQPQTVGPAGVFGVMYVFIPLLPLWHPVLSISSSLLIALLVYLLGGCVYQRTVMNQRGWKQVPNYSIWSGLFGFVVVRRPSNTYIHHN